MVDWYKFEKQKWSWASGWNHDYKMYYAQAWRNLLKPILVDGKLQYRECIIEFSKSLIKAEINLQQRLEQLI